MALLIGNVAFGFAKISNAWPFACYPRFSALSGPQTAILEIVPLSTTGTPIPFEQKDFKGEFELHKFGGLSREILNRTQEPIKKQQQLNALWQVMTRYFPSREPVKSVQFYQSKVWNEPERKLENPVERSLLFELNLQAAKQ